ncbi:MAG: hypothetical protein K0U08_05450 [Proteobacteria bacterium]|nr:hypothetical protein [Pseudomonadota bacterium]
MNDKQDEYQEYLESIAADAYCSLMKFEDVEIDVADINNSDTTHETIKVDDLLDELLCTTGNYKANDLILSILKGESIGVYNARAKYEEIVRANVDLHIMKGR